MSSSNLAVRMELTATDLLSHPPRPEVRAVANHERPGRKRRLRTSFTNRTFVTRDKGLGYFRVR